MYPAKNPLPQRQRPTYMNRTRAGVDNAISQRASIDDLGNKYINCRFAPYGKGGKSFIPDSRGKNIIVRDWAYTYDLTTKDSGGEIRVSPFFPYPVRVYSTDGSLTVDGTAIGAYSVAPTVTNTYGMVLKSVLTNNLNACGTPQTTDTRAITTARIATVGYRLYYTGTASSAQGLVQVDNLPWSFHGEDTLSANAISLIVRGGTSHTSYAQNTVPFFSLDTMPFNQPSKTKDTTILRPEDGLKGTLKSHGLASDHSLQPWWDAGRVPIYPNYVPTQPYAIWSIGTAPNDSTMGGLPGLMCVDPHFMEANIRIIGAGSYRLEVFFCAEFGLSLDHSMIDMAADSPMIDRPLLALAENINHTMRPMPLAEDIINGVAAMAIGGRPARRRRRRYRRRAQRPPCPGTNPSQNPPNNSRRGRRRRNKNARKRTAVTINT